LVGAAWRNGDGQWTGAVCLPFAGSAAAWGVSAAAGTAWLATAGWLAVAVLGYSSALQLVDAGPQLRYQHYPPLASIVSDDPWILAALAAQTVAVVGGLVQQRRRIADALLQLPLRRVTLAVAASVSTAATVSPDRWRYIAELGFAASVQLLSMATIALAMLALPSPAIERLTRVARGILGPTGDTGPAPHARPDGVIWATAAGAAALAAVLSVVIYQRTPHVPDEVVYLQHARYLAEGMLSMPVPPVPAAFELDLMESEPHRWFSPVPPGWPFMLAVGAFAGAPWLVNPLLAGVNVLLAYVVLAALYPVRIARLSAVLLAASPWFLFLGMSYMTHMFMLTCALGAAVSVIQARRTRSLWWAAAAGVGVGATSLIRPLEGAIVGVLVGSWALGIGGSRLRRAPLAALCAGTVGMGALVLPYNYWLTGSPFRFPINQYLDRVYGSRANDYGFGPDRGMGWAIDPNPGHGPVDALINANLNGFGLNTDLFGWSTESLLFCALFLTTGTLTRSDRLMLSVIAVVFTAYFFYYFSGGPDFGPRYWFPMIVPLVALTARGIQMVDRQSGGRGMAAAAALVAISLATFLPWRAIDKYHGFRNMGSHVRRLAAEYQFGADLVLVRGGRFPDYASAAVQNPIDLRSPSTIYAWDRDEKTRMAAIRAYADRRVWLIDGPTVTGAGYRVASGPWAASDLLTWDGPR
jgi:4-amino-4-deoxy-L-arabinose transferase-like glycosyltransferase